MQQQRSGQARAVLAEVQNRHDDMKKIEKTIIVSAIISRMILRRWVRSGLLIMRGLPLLGTSTIVYGYANAG
jgi:hypothetical protein